MRLLEVFTGNQPIFIEENNKKYKKDLNTINSLINQICIKYNDCVTFFNSENYINNISLAKGMNDFFESKKLKLDVVIEYIKKIENDKLSEFNEIKESLLSELNTINNPTEGIVSIFAIENGEFVRCEEGRENVILGEHNNIIYDIINMIEQLNIQGKFETTPPHQITYNTNTLESNLTMCRTKADVAYADKQGKLNKIHEIINKLEEVGHKVVAFYKYKNSLEAIGCNPKCIKDYENELEKMYTPLKKTLQKELKIELEEICNVTVNEEDYEEFSNNSNQTSESPFEIQPQEYQQNQFTNNSNYETQEVSDNANYEVNENTNFNTTENTAFSITENTNISVNENPVNQTIETNPFQTMSAQYTETTTQESQFTSPLSNMQEQTTSETLENSTLNTNNNPFASILNNSNTDDNNTNNSF